MLGIVSNIYDKNVLEINHDLWEIGAPSYLPYINRLWYKNRSGLSSDMRAFGCSLSFHSPGFKREGWNCIFFWKYQV